MDTAEDNIQINPLKSRKCLRETSEPESVKVNPLALCFALILVTNLKLMIS